jgi:hypothetical protein
MQQNKNTRRSQHTYVWLNFLYFVALDSIREVKVKVKVPIDIIIVCDEKMLRQLHFLVYYFLHYVGYISHTYCASEGKLPGRSQVSPMKPSTFRCSSP